MQKHEEFGLRFRQYKNPISGNIKKTIIKHTVNEYSELLIINRLNDDESKALIRDIDNALLGKYFDNFFCAQSIEDENIEIHPPNIVINDMCTIPLTDMKAILEEWIAFKA